METDNAFWDFSIAVYSMPGVASDCVAAQDHCGIDVNLLLFCAWVGHARGVALTTQEVDHVATITAEWQEAVVKPLRLVRRTLKNRSEEAVAVLRAQVKADELEAEKLEQAMLFAFAQKYWPRQGTGSSPVAANLKLYLRLHGCEDEFANPLTECLVAAVQALG